MVISVYCIIGLIGMLFGPIIDCNLYCPIGLMGKLLRAHNHYPGQHEIVVVSPSITTYIPPPHCRRALPQQELQPCRSEVTISSLCQDFLFIRSLVLPCPLIMKI